MSEKKRMKTDCAECDEKFSFYKEPQGVLLIACPFCSVELKIVLEDDEEKVLYRSFKVEK